MVDEHPIYDGLSRNEGERKKKYREFVRGMIRGKKAMKGEMDRRVVYGSEKLVKDVAREYKIGAVIKRVGRPRNERTDSN